MSVIMNNKYGVSFIRKTCRDLEDLKKNKIDGVDVYLNDDFTWTAFITGVPIKGTPYEGGKFELELTLPNDYPFHPPRVKFITPIMHCNITHDGTVSLDILHDNWSPSLTIKQVIQSVCVLLNYPNPHGCVSPDIGKLYNENKAEHDKQIKEHTQRYAK